MDITEFWEIIEPGKHSEEPEQSLRAKLEKYSPEEIESFQAHFDTLVDNAYLWDLWGAAYLIGGGCSDDRFIDFRYALISKGRGIYEKALIDPDSLFELGEIVEGDLDIAIDNEIFGYVSGEIYEDKTGKEIPRTGSPSSDESMGEEWDFEDEAENKKRLPKLYSRYW